MHICKLSVQLKLMYIQTSKCTSWWLEPAVLSVLLDRLRWRFSLTTFSSK